MSAPTGSDTRPTPVTDVLRKALSEVQRINPHSPHDVARHIDALSALLSDAIAENESSPSTGYVEDAGELRDLLTFIAEGRGRFSRDHKTHAENCIEDMKAKAVEAIAFLENKGVLPRAATGERDQEDTK